MPPDSILLSKHYVALARETIHSYNHSVDVLNRAWNKETGTCPLTEISLCWWDLVDAGERDADDELIKEIANEVNKRRNQLELSRNTEQEMWNDVSIRDFGHSNADSALSRTSKHLKSARETVR